jgi:hypothetical protein
MAINPTQSAFAPRMYGEEQSQRQAVSGTGSEGQACLQNARAKAGAPSGADHGHYVHGRQTREVRCARKEVGDIIRAALF